MEYHLTIGPSGGAEWARRLKVAEQSPVHKSTDCIALKELGTSSDSELLKTAPSWSNVALRQETGSTSAPSVKAPSEEEAKGELMFLSTKFLRGLYDFSASKRLK
jgi:hypothetical protein